MKKASKVLALLLSVCLLATAAVSAFADSVSPQPNSTYKRPDQQIYQIKTDLTIDGELEAAWKNEATVIPFTKEALKTSGLVWSYTDDDGLTFSAMPSDGEGTAYIGWTEDFFLFALQITDAKNDNNQMVAENLWKGDCLQLQIGADAASFQGEDVTEFGIERYEFGFALGGASNNRQLGYRWRPEPGASVSATSASKVSAIKGDVAFMVKHTGTTTTYEIALKYSAFGRTAKLAKGVVIPFSFSLHLNTDTPATENDNGWFMEWGRGVVGGDSMGSDIIDPWFGVKNLGSAARLTLGEKGQKVETLPPTTKVTTTKPSSSGTTAKPTSNGGSTVKQPVGGSTAAPSSHVVTGEGGKTVTDAQGHAVTETDPPTTTTAPEMEGVSAYYADEDATDVEESDVVSAITTQLENDEIALPEGNEMLIKSYQPTGSKFAIAADGLSAIYALDEDGHLALLTGEVYKDEEGNENPDWLIYDVSSLEEGASVYVVKNYTPTTTAPATTATTAAKATTTKAEEKGDSDDKESSSWWIWLIIIIVVVVVAVALILFFLLKKKKNNDDDQNPDDGGDDTPAEE